MARLFGKLTHLFLGSFLLFFSSCVSTKSYDPVHLGQSIIEGHSGNKIDDVYFEFEIDTKSDISKQITKEASECIVFCLKNRGFPPGDHYILYVTRIDSSTVEMCRVVADNNGILLINNANHMPLENMLLPNFGCMRGEELYFTLVSNDGSTYLTTSLGSDQIRVKGDDGAVIAVKMFSPKADIFLIEGKKFIPEEKLDLSITYSDKSITYPIFVTKAGEWRKPFEIDLKQYKGGMGTFEVKRQNGEVLVGEYIWGLDSRKSVKGLKR